MSSLAATNMVTPTAHSHSFARPQQRGVVVNPSIPVAGIEASKRQAIVKVIGFRSLVQNWDSHGSQAPSRTAVQAAIDFLLSVPEMLPAPRVVPVSGGGIYFEWSVGNRDLEVTISPDEKIEVVRVQNGEPIDEDRVSDLASVFSWLAAR